MLARIAPRMREMGPRLHPEKTRIVYCQDGRRRGEHQHAAFTFLGFAFRDEGRAQQERPDLSPSSACVSPEALKAKGASSAECGSIGAPTCRWMTWRGG